MAENKNFIIQHKKSNQFAEGTQSPKLPDPDILKYGEIAINYKKGVETISFKNDENEIVKFQNEILITDTEFNGDKDSISKIVIDESGESQEVEMYTKADVDEKFATKEELEDIDVTSQLGDYAKKSDLDEYAKGSDLDNYYTKSETYNRSEIEGLIEDADITEKLEEYVKNEDLETTLQEYVTETKLATELQPYAKTEDLIDVHVKDTDTSVETKVTAFEIEESESDENFDLDEYIDRQMAEKMETLTEKDAELEKDVTNKVRISSDGTDSNTSEGFLKIDESGSDSVEVYTRQQVDSLISQLRAEIEQLKKN